MSFDPVGWERRRADIYNRKVGNLPDKDCKICRNKGNIMVVSEDGTSAIRECKCMGFRRSIQRLERSGLKQLIATSTFEAFETPNLWQEKALETAKEYAVNPAGRWFLAAGQPGSGKTHLCVAICREFMLRGLETRYMRWRDDIPGIKAVVNDDGEYQRKIEPLKRVPVLYIDDFFKTGRGQMPTAPDVNVAFEILNARYINKNLITVISTERFIPDLLEIDEAVGSRIYERSKTSNIIIEGFDKNWRMKD